MGLTTALALLPTLASGQGRTAPKDAHLYFITPTDGDTVKGAFWCRFGLRNMGVTHAGDSFANSGHHHLLIDSNDPISAGEPIPQDRKHLHYGGGETEVRIELPPGKHTLQLVLGDGEHFNFDPPVVSQKITIVVGDETGSRRRSAAHARRKSRQAQAELARSTTPTSTPDASDSSNKAVEFFKGIFGVRNEPSAPVKQ
ncbi:DUF4399 domain-containing protein [Bradyrhizobium sp. HKCCYLS2038]|uniref:DUF4399 domain-containing protein n=1 Tax=unclassified Bradyrhizobium TaxID=2631580 RepID=UPI003EB7DE38